MEADGGPIYSLLKGPIGRHSGANFCPTPVRLIKNAGAPPWKPLRRRCCLSRFLVFEDTIRRSGYRPWAGN